MKAIVVEDEILSREELVYVIENNSDIEVIGTFENGLDVLKFLNDNYVDVMFLDINIPLLDGISLARTLKNFKNRVSIVFITAYEKYAVEAFELDAFDYIMKPYLEERVISTLNKLEDMNKKEKTFQKAISLKDDKLQGKIKLKEKNGLVVLDIDSIYMLKADDKETIIYTIDKTYTILDCLSNVYDDFPKDKFLKTHRSYIVNISKIKNVISAGNSTYKLILEENKLEAYVSRSNIKKFKDIMGL